MQALSPPPCSCLGTDPGDRVLGRWGWTGWGGVGGGTPAYISVTVWGVGDSVMPAAEERAHRRPEGLPVTGLRVP